MNEIKEGELMEGNLIYQKIPAIMCDLKAVEKTSKNVSQGFMYRGIDQVMNALNPLLSKHKVFCVPEVIEQTRDERTNSKGTTLLYSICKMRFTFFAEDGSSISAITVGEGMDSGDKATNKAMAIALKYALFDVFMIPTEEMKDADPDKESHEVISTVSASHVKNIESELLRTGANVESVLARYKVLSLDLLNIKDYNNIMAIFKKMPDKIN